MGIRVSERHLGPNGEKQEADSDETMGDYCEYRWLDCSVH